MLVIIQARTNSKRFPGKILYLVKGKPLIHYVITQVKKAKLIDKVIIATSKNKTDDRLVDYLVANKIRYFRGSLNNVASRFLIIAKKYNKNFFMRLSADSPLISPKIIDRAIKIHKKNKKYDLVSNIFPRTFPNGQSVEIIKTSILENNIKKMNQYDREHVTAFFYKNFTNFFIKNFTFMGLKSNIKLSVDTKVDLKKIIKKIR